MTEHISPFEIHRTARAVWRDWRWQLKNRITSPAGLAGSRWLHAKNPDELGQVLASFPMAVLLVLFSPFRLMLCPAAGRPS